MLRIQVLCALQVLTGTIQQDSFSVCVTSRELLLGRSLDGAGILLFMALQALSIGDGSSCLNRSALPFQTAILHEAAETFLCEGTLIFLEESVH